VLISTANATVKLTFRDNETINYSFLFNSHVTYQPAISGADEHSITILTVRYKPTVML